MKVTTPQMIIEPKQQDAAPVLVAATTNGNLLRFLQNMVMQSGWTFRSFLSGDELLDSLTRNPATLVVLDIFFDKGGFDLRGSIRNKSAVPLAPIMLVAPGCASEEDLSERMHVSRARLDVSHETEETLGAKIKHLMDLSSFSREQFRYSTFLQVAGETCHSVNQPLTALICNLELAMHSLDDESLRQRLQTSYESALRIADIVQRFQQSKRVEERGHALPVYLLNHPED